MQTKKMSLANIKGKLSRAEMKNIMAGSGGGSCQAEGEACNSVVHVNCCTLLVCASKTCQVPTFA